MEKRWIEIFSNGDVWELKEENGKLFGFKTENDASDYREDELIDNGVSTFEERARMMGLEAVRVSDNQDEMEKEIGRTEKITVIEKYLKECWTSLYYLKEKVAAMSIDMTGTMEQEYVLLLRILRGHGPSLEYHKDGTDGYDDHQTFWFEFPLHFYRDIMSGWDIEKDEDGYYLIDTGERTEKLDKEEIKVWLKNDLLEYNYGGFNHPNWENFLDDLYNWIIEPEEVE